ncbi:hypothetical protein PPL_09579 [Heterostelium album PN500]|uniref:Mitochondrial pyruvate carrier n=1 Tax=Heterostelium pallidum (strain ATCC 26659 / Pp 5 / PN500) TaxID=670386 RepID=D3BNQ8_HETP5|nr:hypothetical protein PPL_09579 [Heterostelium album PN500]EFA76827.1 hypothetical protein PPL_09579 [Heterostelium album PN500]|eukprot:XP_020428959.1 hypothetical protein PPL_09579 [Heterostelium album PN500]
MASGEKWVKFIGFLGAAANWTIPIASMMNLKNPPESIDPIMTGTLASYSLVFMRWSIAIKPPNYWLLGCHAANEVAQLTQLTRWGFYFILTVYYLTRHSVTGIYFLDIKRCYIFYMWLSLLALIVLSQSQSVYAIKNIDNSPSIIVPSLSRIRVINTVLDLQDNSNQLAVEHLQQHNQHQSRHQRHHNHNKQQKQQQHFHGYEFDIIFNSSESMRVKGLSYLSMTDYITVPIGLLSISIVDQNNPVVIDNGRDSFTLENDTDYTLIITGIRHNSTSLTFLSDKDNNFGMDPLQQQQQQQTLQRRTSLRFLHCAPQAGTVDFSIVGGATLFSNIGYLGGSSGGGGSHQRQLSSSTNYISIPSNPYIFFVHQPENTSNIYIPGGDNSLMPHQSSIVSILMVGVPGNEKLPLQLIPILYPFGQSDHSIYQKQLPYSQINTQLPPYPASPNTSASSSTLFKFSIAILMFLLLAGISVI